MFGDKIRVFEVGGCVRDSIMGHATKDIDFSVEAESFDVMLSELETLGFTIWQTNPEFVTLRGKFPKTPVWDAWSAARGQRPGLDADFVLCRKDGTYIDGRRPESVTPGTLMDDLSRRDFTVNAMARDMDGVLIDPFNGEQDCGFKKLQFVGSAAERVAEDGLRVLRGLRFMVTKGLVPAGETAAMLRSMEAKDVVANQEVERVFEELKKMFAFDTLTSIKVLEEFGMLSVVLKDVADGRLWFLPTLKDRQVLTLRER